MSTIEKFVVDKQRVGYIVRGRPLRVTTDKKDVYHWNIVNAENMQVLSTFLFFTVTQFQADSLKIYWEQLHRNITN